MSNVTITVTDEDGVILDTVTVTRDEFNAARSSSTAAASIFNSLSIGTSP